MRPTAASGYADWKRRPPKTVSSCGRILRAVAVPAAPPPDPLRLAMKRKEAGKSVQTDGHGHGHGRAWVQTAGRRQSVRMDDVQAAIAGVGTQDTEAAGKPGAGHTNSEHKDRESDRDRDWSRDRDRDTARRTL